MAEPGDPTVPNKPDPAVDHDDLVGFSSAAALQGRARVVPQPSIQPTYDAEPKSMRTPVATPVVEAEPDLFDTPEPVSQAPPIAAPAPNLLHEPIPAPAPAPATGIVPSWAIETPPVPGTVRVDGRTTVPPRDIENSTGLYAVYALILFAVPTLGVSALIALLAVTGRAGPTGAAAAGHFVFQQRTLWAGAVVALLGAILIAVGLGVFVLFIVAVWLILRGASGVLALKAGRAVRNPRGWFLA